MHSSEELWLLMTTFFSLWNLTANSRNIERFSLPTNATLNHHCMHLPLHLQFRRTSGGILQKHLTWVKVWQVQCPTWDPNRKSLSCKSQKNTFSTLIGYVFAYKLLFIFNTKVTDYKMFCIVTMYTFSVLPAARNVYFLICRVGQQKQNFKILPIGQNICFQC